jgi:hypothetical protein
LDGWDSFQRADWGIVEAKERIRRALGALAAAPPPPASTVRVPTREGIAERIDHIAFRTFFNSREQWLEDRQVRQARAFAKADAILTLMKEPAK